MEREHRDNRGDRGEGRGGDRDRDEGGRGGRGGGGRGEGRGGGGGGRGRPKPPIDLVFDFKDPKELSRFVTETGKIVPARISRLSSWQQRQLKLAVKRARTMALLPLASKHTFED